MVAGKGPAHLAGPDNSYEMCSTLAGVLRGFWESDLKKHVRRAPRLRPTCARPPTANCCTIQIEPFQAGIECYFFVVLSSGVSSNSDFTPFLNSHSLSSASAYIGLLVRKARSLSSPTK